MLERGRPRALAGAAILALALVPSRARADEPPPLPPSGSTPAAEPQPAPSPPVYIPHARAAPRRPHIDESQLVTVKLDADKAGAYLEALTAHPGWTAYYGRWHSHIVYGNRLRWQPICAAPCAIRVPPNLVYRVAGPTVSASDDFSLGPPQSEENLHVRAGSRSARSAGAVSLALGVTAAIVGVIFVAASRETRTAGYVIGGGGLGVAALGGVLLATSGTSVSDDRGPVATNPPNSKVALGQGGLVW